jgi:hypothetical protein
LAEDARELEALDSTAAAGIRLLGRTLVAMQFECCGGLRLRELGMSLRGG